MAMRAGRRLQELPAVWRATCKLPSTTGVFHCHRGHLSDEATVESWPSLSTALDGILADRVLFHEFALVHTHILHNKNL